MAGRGGVMRAAELIRAGATRADLRRCCAERDIERLREGLYALPSARADVRTAATHGGALACVSALRHHGIWVLDAPGVHVWLGRGGRAHAHPGCRCVAHWETGRARPGVVSVARALVQVARCRGSEAFFVAYESAWRLGKLTATARTWIRQNLDAGMRYLVDFARPDADSGLESLVRLRLAKLGIVLQSQVSIRGVGVVDFVLDGRIILEVDGRENHDGGSSRHKDLGRDARALALGYLPLRFDYAQVMYEWHLVEAAILGARETLGRRSLRPVAGRRGQL
ncbi:type IV toxin-antitoxin system AbiEi family antitoxin domain-containing protein [Microbacterium marinilacus]|nr:type IV toxin-antitoxin system AbiEi family antitoxin domain-containing protein [Microbacterium marinilacus]